MLQNILQPINTCLTLLIQRSNRLGISLLSTFSTTPLTAVRDVKMSVTTSWNCWFRGHLIITLSLGLYHNSQNNMCSIVQGANYFRKDKFSMFFSDFFFVHIYLNFLNNLIKNWRCYFDEFQLSWYYVRQYLERNLSK